MLKLRPGHPHQIVHMASTNGTALIVEALASACTTRSIVTSAVTARTVFIRYVVTSAKSARVMAFVSTTVRGTTAESVKEVGSASMIYGNPDVLRARLFRTNYANIAEPSDVARSA